MRSSDRAKFRFVNFHTPACYLRTALVPRFLAGDGDARCTVGFAGDLPLCALAATAAGAGSVYPLRTA